MSVAICVRYKKPMEKFFLAKPQEKELYHSQVFTQYMKN